MQELSVILEPFKIETDNLQGEKVMIPLKNISILKVGLKTWYSGDFSSSNSQYNEFIRNKCLKSSAIITQNRAC